MLLGEIIDEDQEEELNARELAYKLREQELAYRQLRCLFMDLIEAILNKVNVRP